MMASKQLKLALVLIVVPILYELQRSTQQYDEEFLYQMASSWDTSIRPPQHMITRVAVG